MLWIVGEPGAGKSTLARALLGAGLLHAAPKRTVSEPGRGPLGCRVLAAGHYVGGPFDGADTVAYNGVRAWVEWWGAQDHANTLTVLDGDRFSHAAALEAFARPSVDLRCARLFATDELAAARRLARSAKVQNAAWVKGRCTKARRFAAFFPVYAVLALDAARPDVALRDQVREWLGA